MKKVNKKKVFGVFKRIVLTLLALFLLFALPLVKLGSENLSMIYNTFLGQKSKYQGIIEIWNIDTFESGSASKSSFLLGQSKIYQSKNKGLLFMIRNMTEQECVNLLESGEMPDLFSCSYGVASEIKNYIQPFSESSKNLIKTEFEMAGTINDDLYGLAWCRGNYFLISTKEKLQKAKVNTDEAISLSDLALNVGYQVKNKNSEKIVYSLEIGSGKYGMPQMALKTYNIMGEPSKLASAIDSSSTAQTGYTAYTKFVAGGSVILLGTQRDVVRMENKVAQQKVSDVVYQSLGGWTDLVQFFFLGNTQNEIKTFYAESFAKFVVSESSQKKLATINMFPVISASADDYELGVMKDIIPEINGNYEVFNVFLSKNEIDGLRLEFNLG